MSSGSLDFGHITTVIFDMDGTLLEHTWTLSRVCHTLFNHFADRLSSVSEAEFFDTYWPKSEDMWHLMVEGVLDGDTAAKYAYHNTLRALGQDTNLAELMLDQWVEIVLNEATPFDDAVSTLDKVRNNYTTGILTNGYTHLQQRKIDKYQFAAYVDFTLISEDAGYHKPDQRAFVEALKLAGDVAPENALYVGDKIKADIEGAIGAGLTPIFMNVKNKREIPESVVTIQRLSDLLPLLEL